MKSAIRITTIFCLIMTLLVGCGYHLRGSVILPSELSLLSVEYKSPEGNTSGFQRRFMSALSDRGITINTESDNAYHLVITEENLNDYEASISADGIVRQHELRFTIMYQLLSPQGDVISKPTPVSSSQVITINTDLMLASDLERSQTITKLHRDVLIKLLRQMRTSTLNYLEHRSVHENSK